MQVKHTYIVKTESGTLTVMYHTFDGKYYINTQVAGQVKLIALDEVKELMGM